MVMMSLNPKQRSILWFTSSSEQGLICDFAQKPPAVASMTSVQNHLKWSTSEFHSEVGILRACWKPVTTSVSIKRNSSGPGESKHPDYPTVLARLLTISVAAVRPKPQGPDNTSRAGSKWPERGAALSSIGIIDVSALQTGWKSITQ